jgi:hypothetical protein
MIKVFNVGQDFFVSLKGKCIDRKQTNYKGLLARLRTFVMEVYYLTIIFPRICFLTLCYLLPNSL